MACGTPVIGSSVGGIKYTVDHGKTGFLVPPDNPDLLATTISQLIKDKSLLQAMQKNALTRVHTFFTWQTIAEMVSSMYEKVIVTRFTEVLKMRSIGSRNHDVHSLRSVASK
jgi:glycosyltransferase involved in cell wall biosynthesis